MTVYGCAGEVSEAVAVVVVEGEELALGPIVSMIVSVTVTVVVVAGPNDRCL